MAQLYTLLFGLSKKRMKPIMIDDLHKVENYKRQREATKGSKAGRGWHAIVPAEPNSNPWRKESATKNGNSPTKVKRHGEGLAGYVDKHGFNAHT